MLDDSFNAVLATVKDDVDWLQVFDEQELENANDVLKNTNVGSELELREGLTAVVYEVECVIHVGNKILVGANRV